MDELKYRVLGKDEFIYMEKVRCDAYDMEYHEINKGYFEELCRGKLLVFGCYYHETLVGGAYLSNFLNSLYVEQIFVKKNYQNHDLHIGYHLLKYILEHKDIFEEYFHTSFKYSRLESRNHDSFYQALGYCYEDNLLGTMKKKV